MVEAFSRTDTSLLGRWWWTIDRYIFFCILTLMAIGLVLTMAGSPAVADRLHLGSFYFARHHFIMLIPALLIMVGVSLLDIQTLQKLAWFVFVVAIILLIATLVMGQEIKGARRWINIMGISVQASEILKPAFAVVVAWLFSESKYNPIFPGHILSCCAYGFVVLLLLMQPDLGMTVVMSAIWFLEYFLAGLSVFFSAMIVVGGVLGLGLLYLFLPHVASRIDRFFGGATDKYADQYQIHQSLEAFMTGGMVGLGPGEGTVKRHIPDAHADFIFAVAGEEFGLILCLTIVGLFCIIVLRAFRHAFRHDNMFVLLAVSGLAVQFGLQALINMASTLHLIPTKGMTLPFISYGGSSILALAFGMGMLLGLTRRRLTPDGWN